MRARAISLGLALVACSSGPQAGVDAGADAAGDAGYQPRGTACVASDASAPLAWTAPPAAPPNATLPHPPVMHTFGGPVIANPIFVPITFDGDPFRDPIEDMVASIGCTSYWRSIVGDYGVGDAVMGTPVHVSEAPPTTLNTVGVGNFIRSKITSHAAPAPIAGRTLYVITFPESTTLLQGGGQNCTSFGGYHESFQMADGTSVPFAIVSECSSFRALTGFDVVSVGLSHELIEAVSDPLGGVSPAYFYPEFSGAAWQFGNGGGEVGDLCQMNDDAFFVPSDYPFTVPHAWSSSAAFFGQNPCQPASEPFFAAVPVLPDTLTFDLGGTRTTPGVKLALAASATIDLRLASPSAWPDAIDVEVRDFAYPSAPALTFDLPATTGHVGDVLSLTVRRIGSSPKSGPFEPFSIRATSRGITHVWWAVVGDP